MWVDRPIPGCYKRRIGNGQGDIYNRLTPAVDGKFVVAAAADGTVSRLRLADGEQQWSITLEQSLLGGVGVGESQLLLGTGAGDIIAIDKENGEQLWSVNVGGEVLSAPQSNKNKVFVQTVDGKMLALSAQDGSQLWSYTNNVPVLTLRGTSTPLLFRDTVIAGFANGNVVSFNQQTGTVQWNVRVSMAKGNSEIDRIVDVDGNLLLGSKLLYATNYQGRIVAIDPNSGSRAWANEASSNSGMSTGFGNYQAIPTPRARREDETLELHGELFQISSRVVGRRRQTADLLDQRLAASADNGLEQLFLRAKMTVNRRLPHPRRRRDHLHAGLAEAMLQQQVAGRRQDGSPLCFRLRATGSPLARRFGHHLLRCE